MGRTWAGCALAAWLCLSAVADAQLPSANPLLHPVFSDHAVLQRDRPIQVWGWARPRERVTVTFDASSAQARADATGRWRAILPARAAGGPFALNVRAAGGETQTISDVLVGDVYLCSGQSNMEFQTRYATNAYSVLNEASDERLRLFHVTRTVGDAPLARFAAPDHWSVAARDSVGDFSAVCYFFGRHLRQRTQMPIGLIDASWGGTPIEAWMSADSIRRLGGFDAQLSLLAQYRTDPAAARARQARMMEEWWRANDPGGRAGWSAPDFDASAWATILPSGFWEDAGVRELAGFDGVVWYRTEFTLTAEQAAQGGRFSLGPADDIDATFLNGRLIGGVSGWNTPRTYEVAPGALRAGRNVLASAVLDSGGGGGWWGPAAEKVLILADGARVALNNTWRYRISARLSDVSPPRQAAWDGPNAYSALYNGMIAPIAPYGVRGALWYQGESNANAPEDYARLLPGMMADWRRAFEAPELHFFIVQLSSYGAPVAGAPQRGGWGAIRDVQRRVAAADPHAGLAVSIDVGDRFDIHPTQKRVVADRLALLARRMIYGEDVPDSGPAPLSARREAGSVLVRFAHGPLVAYSASRPMAFELCDAARVCRFVDAEIAGDSVRLDARGVSAPAFVRYCWGAAPVCNLYNEADLPAAAFELAVE
jgi:sialate O-acetylesterase